MSSFRSSKRNPFAARLQWMSALATLLTLSSVAMAQSAQPSNSGFTPQIGQSGKDVIWVPTPDALVARMLNMAKVGPNDVVVDLGSGDGKIAIAAARLTRAKSRGIEFNPDMVTLSRENARAAGVGEMVQFIQGDIFTTDFTDATVITMYLLPSLNLKLRPKLLEMRPGTRIVTHAFDMGDWEADETASAESRMAFLWIVPAQAHGTWRLETEGPNRKELAELQLKQKYQKLDGTVRRGGRLSPVSGMLQGDRIRFSIQDSESGDRVFTGRVIEGRIEGRMRAQSGAEVPFVATR
jgi:SAM-dependent methyltransferase